MTHDKIPTTLLGTALRGRTSVPSREIRVAFANAGYNARTLQRAAAANPNVLRLGETNRTRYALTRPIADIADRFPLSIVDVDGQVKHVATLFALQNDHWAVLERDGLTTPHYTKLGSEDHLFYGLPWYLASWRPEGFIGRNLVHRFAGILGAPTDLTQWTDDHVVVANARGVIDPLGNWVLGETLPAGDSQPWVEPVARATAYADRATRAAGGEPSGSSAGGEQPKFTAILARPNGPVHVLVKFSPPRGDAVGDRWADLLVCEHLAAALLLESGIVAPRTEIVEAGQRLCLEVERFDRQGLSGRRGTASLMALSASLNGPPSGWTASARFLRDRDVVEEAVVTGAALLDAFGDRIGNTDRHLGNLAVLLDDGPPFRLAPVYDMLPMRFRPSAQGELPRVELAPAVADPVALALAGQFWRRVAEHPLITPAFRDGAASIARHLSQAIR